MCVGVESMLMLLVVMAESRAKETTFICVQLFIVKKKIL
jgi:hypothetical protein